MSDWFGCSRLFLLQEGGVVRVFLHALEQRFVAVGNFAFDRVDQPADFGGDVVELFAHMRLLDALGIPVGHDRRLDRQHLGAEAFQFVLDGELFGEEPFALPIGLFAAYVASIIVPIVVREVVPAVVQAVVAN